MNEQNQSFSGQSEPAADIFIDEEAAFGLSELCHQFAVRAEWILSLVDEGILDPMGDRPNEWRFNVEHCRRIGVVLRLERDLDVNLSGAALILDLLEEVETLRIRMEKERR